MEAGTHERRGGAPEPIRSILERFLARSGIGRPARWRRVAEAWCEAAGTDLADHTRLMAFRRGILEVAVDSAPLLQELAHFRKAELLARLREVLGTIYVRDIRFRPGPVGGEDPAGSEGR